MASLQTQSVNLPVYKSSTAKRQKVGVPYPKKNPLTFNYPDQHAILRPRAIVLISDGVNNVWTRVCSTDPGRAKPRIQFIAKGVKISV